MRPWATWSAIWSSWAVSSSVAMAGAAEPVGAAGGAQLGAGALRPRLGAEALEHLRARGRAGCARRRGAWPAQALAVQELGARGLERLAGLAVELERAGEVRVDLVVGRHQAADALHHRLRPRVVRAVGLAGELLSRGGTSSWLPSRHSASSRSGA